MANAQRGNKILIDSTGLVAGSSRTKVVYALFTPSTADDSVTLNEAEGDAAVVFLQGANAKNTMYFRFDEVPLVFSAGIYVSAISSGAKLVLVTTQGAS